MNSHIDFIVGRCRKSHPGGLNLPLHPNLKHRNLIFIDADKEVCPDICSELSNVDFTCFGIDCKQDIQYNIQVRFIFDVSSVFCGGIQSIHSIFMKLRRPFEVYIPLNTNETSVPADVKRILWQPVFRLSIENKAYPLFDWNFTKASSYLNPHSYIRVMCNFKNSHP